MTHRSCFGLLFLEAGGCAVGVGFYGGFKWRVQMFMEMLGFLGISG